jgi:hypothetical protein
MVSTPSRITCTQIQALFKDATLVLKRKCSNDLYNLLQYKFSRFKILFIAVRGVMDEEMDFVAN